MLIYLPGYVVVSETQQKLMGDILVWAGYIHTDMSVTFYAHSYITHLKTIVGITVLKH